MTNEEVMQLMTGMGLHEGGMDDWVFDNAWVMFANAVASAEREACAKLADEWAVNWPHPAKTIALDIRARGEYD